MNARRLSFLSLVGLSVVFGCGSSSEPLNGTLKCGAVDKSCPAGFQCSAMTDTCWRLGTLPDAASPAILDAAVDLADTVAPNPDVSVDTAGVTGNDAEVDLVAIVDGAADRGAAPDEAEDVPATIPQTDASDVAIDVPTSPACRSDNDCPGACQSCTNGICLAVKGKDDPSGHCPGTCDGAGACKAKQGQVCASGGQCANGICSPDGVCCDRACTGACEACDFPAALGTCAAVSGNSHSGHASCTGSAAECAGSCTGASDGQCAWPTSPCGPAASCTTQTNAQAQATGTTFTSRSVCNAGACSAPVTAPCPGALVCASATACKDSCASDADCLAERHCVGGACVARFTNGHSCNAANECQSGHCVDGNCCDSACGGTCQACNIAGRAGTCSNVPGDTTGARGCESSCDGTGNCTGNGVCGFGYSTCTRKATVLHRMDLTCANGTPRSGLQQVDLSSGYSNYTCQNRYQEACIDDGSFDAYYMEWCDYASATCIARGNGMYSCDPGAVPAGSCSPVKLHRRVFDCKGAAQSGEQIVDLVATGYTNYQCANRFKEACVDDGSWDGYYSEWCEYKCQ